MTIHYFLYFIFIVFIIAGIKIYFKTQKNIIEKILASVFIIVGSYNLIKKYFLEPSLIQLKAYNEEFRSMNIDTTIVLNLKTHVINEEFKEIKKKITNNNDIIKIISDLKKINEDRIFKFERSGLISEYYIDFQYNNKNYFFEVNERSSNKLYLNSFIKIKDKKYLIGNYIEVKHKFKNLLLKNIIK